MTLEGTSRFLINIDDDTIRITWEIYADIDIDSGHLFVYLRL